MNEENELIDAFLEPRSSENVPAQYAHDLAHVANRLRAERDACRVYSAEFTKRIKELTNENEHLRLVVEGLKEESRELRAMIERVESQCRRIIRDSTNENGGYDSEANMVKAATCAAVLVFFDLDDAVVHLEDGGGGESGN